MVQIPLVDLKAQYEIYKEEIDEAVSKVISNTAFVGGPFVKSFEENFATFCGTKFAIGVANGTCALFLALIALDIEPGDEIIVPTNTFIATAEAVTAVGAKPVFVDVEPLTYNIDPDEIKKSITKKSRAIIPVHLYGQPADMESIQEIADTHHLEVIEDAAQAHEAQYGNKRVGGFGRLACFSFYPGKNLGAYGDAGAVVTNDERLFRKIAMLRDHGRKTKYYYEMPGFNMRMDGIQGAILDVKLRHLPKWNKARQNIAARYSALLENTPEIKTPQIARDRTHVFHLYVVETDKRDELKQHLNGQGIGSGIHYPVPLHLQPAYQHFNYREGDMPVSEKASQRILSLPIYPELSEENITRVVNAIKNFYNKD